MNFSRRLNMVLNEHHVGHFAEAPIGQALDWLVDNFDKDTAKDLMTVRYRAFVNEFEAVEEESRIPSNDVIAVVATGGRRFTDAQREWCVGEAMVLSNFQFTPMELIAQGDARIARIITEAKRGHSGT